MKCAECRQVIEKLPCVRTKDGRCYHWDCVTKLRRAEREAREGKVGALARRRAKRGAA